MFSKKKKETQKKDKEAKEVKVKDKKEKKSDGKTNKTKEDRPAGSEISWVVKTGHDGSRIEEKVYKNPPDKNKKSDKPNGVLKKKKKDSDKKSTKDVLFTDEDGQVHNSVVDVTNTLLYQKTSKQEAPPNGAYQRAAPIKGVILRDSSGNPVAVGSGTSEIGVSPPQSAAYRAGAPGHVTNIRMPGPPPSTNRNIPGPVGADECQACGSKSAVARAYSNPEGNGPNRGQFFQRLSLNDEAALPEGGMPNGHVRRASDQQRSPPFHLDNPGDHVQYAQLMFHKPSTGEENRVHGSGEPKLKGILKNKKVEFNETPDVNLVPKLTHHVSVDSLWYPDPNVQAAMAASNDEPGSHPGNPIIMDDRMLVANHVPGSHPDNPIIMDDTILYTMRRKNKCMPTQWPHAIQYESHQRPFFYDDAVSSARRRKCPPHGFHGPHPTVAHYPKVIVGRRMPTDWF